VKRIRRDTSNFLHAALGVWLGIYAFRTFVPAAVWNLSDALPLYAKGAIAIGVHLAGVLGCLLPFTRKPRSAIALAIALAITSVLRQVFLGSDVAGSGLALLSWILWLWWLAAFTRLPARAAVLAPAMAAGFALQVGVQAVSHGLDLPMMRGAPAVLCALAISAAFVLTSGRQDDGEEATSGTIGLIGFGAVLFLEITLLANVGRVGFMTGLPLASAALLIEAGLTGALLLLAFGVHRAVLFLCMAVLLISSALAARLHGNSAILLVLAQPAAIVLLHAAVMRRSASHALTFAAGSVLSFLLIFLFYNHYEWPALWRLAAAAVAVCALPRTSWRRISHRYAAAGFAGAALALLAIPRAAPRNNVEPSMRVLTYNIHQGYDAAGVPAMQQIANEIEKFDADVIALQEVGRGWTLVGGSDLVAYLQYRFPDYQLYFQSLNGQLLGVVLLSRVPAVFSPGVVFTAAPGVFRYGYAQADVRFGGRYIHFVSVHLTAGLEGNGGAGRSDQMTQLLNAQQAQNDVVIMGDFNAQPTDPPIQQILRSGYSDAAARVGLAGFSTWPAAKPVERDDYVFVRGAVQVVNGAVPHTTASDHLPLLLMLK